MLFVWCAYGAVRRRVWLGLLAAGVAIAVYAHTGGAGDRAALTQPFVGWSSRLTLASASTPSFSPALGVDNQGRIVAAWFGAPFPLTFSEPPPPNTPQWKGSSIRADLGTATTAFAPLSCWREMATANQETSRWP